MIQSKPGYVYTVSKTMKQPNPHMHVSFKYIHAKSIKCYIGFYNVKYFDTYTCFKSKLLVDVIFTDKNVLSHIYASLSYDI